MAAIFVDQLGVKAGGLVKRTAVLTITNEDEAPVRAVRTWHELWSSHCPVDIRHFRHLLKSGAHDGSPTDVAPTTDRIDRWIAIASAASERFRFPRPADLVIQRAEHPRPLPRGAERFPNVGSLLSFPSCLINPYLGHSGCRNRQSSAVHHCLAFMYAAALEPCWNQSATLGHANCSAFELASFLVRGKWNNGFRCKSRYL
ncbi:hypothetical protein J6590_035280 [Homalodisca vitripennis]|nr:hypothetical protein J6590_035280 [Homalodisca vitripennis]